MSTTPSKNLETFANPHSQRNYTIDIKCPEFSCVCPLTGQPDFACIYITYIPDKLCLELKSLKLYLWSYRNEGSFHEAITNKILEDLVAACSPRKITVKGEFNIRGGILTSVEATHPDTKLHFDESSTSSQITNDTRDIELIAHQHEIGHRPWGKYEVLADADTHKIKKITVDPGKRLSLQRHQHRTEHWVVIEGKALFTLDDQQQQLAAGDVVKIPAKAAHRIQNCGAQPLVFAEVQRGTYFGEDDIERLEDDFGRK